MVNNGYKLQNEPKYSEYIHQVNKTATAQEKKIFSCFSLSFFVLVFEMKFFSFLANRLENLMEI